MQSNQEVNGYPNGYQMKHKFRAILDDETRCLICGYSIDSHTPSAECEVCGNNSPCDFYPDYRHAKKILLCEACYNGQLRAAIQAAEESRKQREQHKPKTPGDYFVSDSPSIKSIINSIELDSSIENKPEAICSVIRDKILNFQQSILELNQQVREAQREQNEFQIYLNHKMREVSADAQKRLGLQNISYKPNQDKPKTPSKAPSTKKVNMDELKKYANQFNIPISALRTIMVARSVSVEQAAKIFIQVNSLLPSE
jgi:hypothetical protein